jgi:hypothetical protein
MLWWRKKEIKKNVKEQSTRCCYNGEKGWQEEEWKEGKKEAQSGVRVGVDGNNINRELHRHGME